jgi:hypothetical protein
MIFRMIFIAHYNPAKIVQPRKQPLDFPASFVAAQASAVLRFGSSAILFVRSNQFNFKAISQLFVERVRIIRLVTNQTFWSVIGESPAERFFNEFDFVRRSRIGVDGERKTSTVCHCHEFLALAPLCCANFAAPFFDTINVPSIKHSERSSLPRRSKSSAKLSKTSLSLSVLTHCWKRRWQVWYGGNLSGKSHHRAPVRNIHKTPFITSRSERRGLPRVVTTDSLSNNGSITDHCSSVNSSLSAMREVYQTIFEIASSNLSKILPYFFRFIQYF